MQQDVVRFQRGIGFQFATPVPFLALFGEQAVARPINGRSHPADQIVNFSEAYLRQRRRGRWGGGIFHNSSIYSAAAPVGALAIASTISGGRPNRTFSGMTSTSCTLPKPSVPRNFTTSSTRHSGAEAPAVSAIVFTPCSHSGRMLRKLSIRCELVPRLRATSTKRLELELLSEPTTSSKSASDATCFTATCRFSVA